MTDNEFSKFLNHLYICFPSVREWLLKNSPNATSTESLWRSILREYSLPECVLVVDSWVTGKRKGFQAYERDQVSLLIKQTIDAERDKARRSDFARNSREEVLTCRRTYSPTAMSIPALREAYFNGRDLMQMLAKGEITRQEFEARKQRLIDAL